MQLARQEFEAASASLPQGNGDKENAVRARKPVNVINMSLRYATGDLQNLVRALDIDIKLPIWHTCSIESHGRHNP